MENPASADLAAFIAHARSRGLDHQTIRMLLISAGWKERDIARAIGAEGLDMPVPMPADAGGARDAFFHLVAYTSLYTVVISFVYLVFAFIERWFPDPALERDITEVTFRDTVRWPLAGLVVAYPLFLWVSQWLLREMSRHVEKQSSAVRRWLTYLTLFVAAAVLVGDLTTLVYTFLGGEVTVRFLLKVSVVLIVAGGIFIYYLTALRRAVAKNGSLHRIFAAVTSLLVMLTVVYGFVVVGSPGTERQRKLDAQRVSDIRMISEATFDYLYLGNRWARPLSAPRRELPATIDEVATATVGRRLRLTDPDGKPYSWHRDDDTHFRICTAFAFADREQNAPFWDHPGGEHCYVFDVTRPDLP